MSSSLFFGLPRSLSDSMDPRPIRKDECRGALRHWSRVARDAVDYVAVCKNLTLGEAMQVVRGRAV
jgi:hypothetical protein